MFPFLPFLFYHAAIICHCHNPLGSCRCHPSGPCHATHYGPCRCHSAEMNDVIARHKSQFNQYSARAAPPPLPNPRKHTHDDVDHNHGGGKRRDFRLPTESRSPSVCGLCGGRHDSPHNCKRTRTWDGKHECACFRNNGNQLELRTKAPFCFNFNLPKGCTSAYPGHLDRHICSLCSETSHGAQSCPRAQKAY
jgi:hypothetical protein